MYVCGVVVESREREREREKERENEIYKYKGIYIIHIIHIRKRQRFSNSLGFRTGQVGCGAKKRKALFYSFEW